jgi:phage baseplate assembly protein W
MVASGNGNPVRCANNLLLITRGEVAYERVKGLDPEVIDMRSDEAAAKLEISARWNIKTYEPRVGVKSIKINQTGNNSHGTFDVTAEVEIM